MEEFEAETQGVRDAATVLPFLAVVLLVPPIILSFCAPVMIAGVPLIFIYIFGVWAGIILGALAIAMRLGRASESDPQERSGSG
jgi:uncharacterized membrane protein